MVDMRDYSHLPEATLNEIEELKRQRKLTLPVGISSEYYRLTARIQYLRRPDEIRAGIYAWRKKNKPRIIYERSLRTAQRNRVPRIYTEAERLARNEAVRRHEAKNPQRVIRQRIERILLMFYRKCAEGRLTGRTRYRVEDLLGCRAHEFREHIREQLARKGWLWSEWRKKWTMDHVVPVRKFKLPEEQFACWHYTNLRPLAKHLNHRVYRG